MRDLQCAPRDKDANLKILDLGSKDLPYAMLTAAKVRRFEEEL